MCNFLLKNSRRVSPAICLVSIILLGVALAFFLFPAQMISRGREAIGVLRYSPQIALCSFQGGQLRSVGLKGSKMCVIKYSDAGKPCNGPLECLGNECIATNGQTDSMQKGVCKSDNNPFGCNSKVRAGIVGPAICVD